MSDYEPIELHAFFRARHSTLWELADKAGAMAQLGMTLRSLDACAASNLAEDAIFNGKVDFVAGNHITPYVWVARGKPIVCLASPNNSVRNRAVTRQPVSSLAELTGNTLRVADSTLISASGGYHHGRGNHILDVEHAGFEPEAVEWLDLGDSGDPGYRAAQYEALTKDRADVTFVSGGAEEWRREGFNVLELDTLPMINGPTITTSYEALNKKDRLGERLVRAMVLTIHYARMHPEEAQRLLDARMGRPYQERGGRAASIARLPIKPYPAHDAIANAYDLCSRQYPDAQLVSPVALWDIHYLRDLDLSGFIDELIQEEPESARLPRAVGGGE